MVLQTSDEFVRERLHELMAAVAIDIGRAVQPIYFATNGGRPEHLGSCVLVKYQSRHLLVTAAHVIDANKVTSLYIPIKGKLLQRLTGSGIATTAPSGVRDRDHFDFSIIELPSTLVDALGPVRYVQEQELQAKIPAGRACMAFGYPNSRNKKIDHRERKIRSKRFSYGGPLFIPAAAVDNSAALESHLVRIKYDRQSRTIEGAVVNSIDPTGISGGGFFDLGNIVAVSPVWKEPPKLAGILFARRRKEKAILATNIDTVLGSL